MTAAEIITICFTLVGAIVTITIWAFKMGKFTATLNENTRTTVKMYEVVVKQDERMDQFDLALKDKADKVDLDKVESRLTVMETKHNSFHGGE